MITQARSQTIVMTAYRNWQVIDRLIEWACGRVNFIIHIDAKALAAADVVQHFNSIDGVEAVSKYKVWWGSLQHLQAVLLLLPRALEVTDTNGYIHLHSGQDYPIVPVGIFEKFFLSNDRIFMGVADIGDSPNIRRWYERIYPLSRFNTRALWVRVLREFSWAAQAPFPRRKMLGGLSPYKGQLWSSFPAEVVSYVLHWQEDHDRFWRDISTCMIPEELFFQTILMNSEFKERVTPNVIYTDWAGGGGNPKTLLLEDLPAIEGSKCLWARKCIEGRSDELMSALDRLNGLSGA